MSLLKYTMVKFRKPGLKGETWYVSVFRRGGGPYTKDGIDLRIPATFVSEVTQHVTGRYHVYGLAEFEKSVKLKKIDDFPPTVMEDLYKKAVAFCHKHGFKKVVPKKRD